jgi:hypothetical protein
MNMRDRKVIESKVLENSSVFEKLTIELLLDIRDLLMQKANT